MEMTLPLSATSFKGIPTLDARMLCAGNSLRGGWEQCEASTASHIQDMHVPCAQTPNENVNAANGSVIIQSSLSKSICEPRSQSQQSRDNRCLFTSKVVPGSRDNLGNVSWSGSRPDDFVSVEVHAAFHCAQALPPSRFSCVPLPLNVDGTADRPAARFSRCQGLCAKRRWIFSRHSCRLPAIPCEHAANPPQTSCGCTSSLEMVASPQGDRCVRWRRVSGCRYAWRFGFHFPTFLFSTSHNNNSA
jgi:hypothetical protein